MPSSLRCSADNRQGHSRVTSIRKRMLLPLKVAFHPSLNCADQCAVDASNGPQEERRDAGLLEASRGQQAWGEGTLSYCAEMNNIHD
jgi:hypothetical protein